MPKVYSAIGSLRDPSYKSLPPSQSNESLPELTVPTRPTALTERRRSGQTAPPKVDSPRSVRGMARQSIRRRPAPLLLHTPEDARLKIQPTPPSIPSLSSSPWEQLHRGGQMSKRTPRPYNGLAGPRSLGTQVLRSANARHDVHNAHDDSSQRAHSLAAVVSSCPHCERLGRHCEKLREVSEQLKRKLSSQRAEFATLEKQRRRLDQKLLEMERAHASCANAELERDAIVNAVAAETARVAQQDREGLRIDQLAGIGGEKTGPSVDSTAPPLARVPISSPFAPLSPSTTQARVDTIIVQPASCLEGATKEEEAWVAAAQNEGFSIVAGPTLMGDGRPWGKQRLTAPTPAQRRCVALARRSTGLSPASATKHFLLVRPPMVGAVAFEITHAIPLGGCAVGCTVTEDNAQCGRLRVLPSPSTTLSIPGGTYVEELWLSSLKISNDDALHEMKEWTMLLQPLTLE